MTKDKAGSLQLPESVTAIELDGRTIHLLGTAHVSKKSVQEVRDVIEALRPDAVCIELCTSRHKALMDRDAWKQMNILKVVREKKAMFLLSQLIMTSFYRKLGDQLGVQPGAEMLEGARMAKKVGADLVLADRDVEVTLKRVWGGLSLFKKMHLIFQLLTSVFPSDEIDEKAIEEIKQKDQLEHALQAFAEQFPDVKERLIDERDIYLAQKIAAAPGENVLAVVGAGHVQGIVKHIYDEHPLEPLMELPQPSKVLNIVKWIIPAAILGLLAYGFYKGGAETSLEAIYIWVVVNAVLSAMGAALALAHPVTILATFIAAPITSLNPMIAAGWVSGLVQAKMRGPTVADLEDLPTAITSVKGFWRNPVTRILLVVVLANLGSSIGTFLSGSLIAVRVL